MKLSPPRAELVAAAAALTLCVLSGAGCTGLQNAARSSTADPTRAPGTALASIAADPTAYRGRPTRTAGWIVASGAGPEGVWLALSDSPPPTGAEGRAATADLLLLIDAAVPALAFADDAGKPVAALLDVRGTVPLADGRTAVRAFPIQLAVHQRSAPSGDASGPQGEEPTTAERAAIAATARSALERPAARTRDFFADPALPASSAQPELRYVCHDPGLAPPRFHKQGPVIIERTGDPGGLLYRFATTVADDDGAVRESECRFRVADGKLRSETYDERVLDATGVVEERHLDFRSGSYLDKSTGTRGPWPANIYAAPCLGFALSGFPFEDAEVVRFHLWSEYDNGTPMFAAVDGRQAVRLEAGAFDAYRVRMNVDERRLIGKLALPSHQGYEMARAVLERMRPPDTTWWLTTSTPHVVVRTDTVPGPPGTTRCTIEATTVSPSIPRLSAR